MEKIHVLPTPFLKKASLLLIFMLQPVISSAVVVEIDGIMYDIVKKGAVAQVLTKSPQYYTGDIVIPASVTYEDVECAVTSIEAMAFYYCSDLTSVTIPSSVTSIEYQAFQGCKGLTSLTIPSSVTSIGDYAFRDCPGLTSVHITDIAAWCKIDFSGFESNPLYIAHHLFLEDQEVQDLVIPSSVTSIGNYAFSYCSGLTSVTIPSSVTNIGQYAFYGCSGLTSVTIPSSVTSIGKNAFSNCPGLTAVHITDLAAWCKIDFSGFESNPLYYVNHLFLEGQEVKDLVIPSSVTSIGASAFSGCSGLTSVTIPSSLTSIESGAFSGCSGLTSVTIPSSVTSIEDGTFSGCSGLTSVTIPSSVTTIGKYAFYGCSGLTSVTISSSLTSIGEAAFYGCSGLTSVTIPSSVTSIGKSAFSSCSGLTSVTLPSSVISISQYAFADCTELSDVSCYAETLPITSSDAFIGSYPEYSTLHVPASAIASYSARPPWSSFGSIVTLDGSEPVIPQCAAPAILYDNGRLEFACETEGAVCHYSVTDSDIQSGTGSSLTLSLTYHITAYATKEGYTSSEVSEATLCWIDYAPRQEGITTDMGNVKMETLANLQAKPVIITNHGGTLTISGAEDGTEVRVYDSSGVLCGSGISLNNQARITTDLPSGSIAIVQLGSRSVKVIVK